MGRDRCEQIITRRLDVFWCAQHVMSTQRMKKQALTEDTVMMHWRFQLMSDNNRAQNTLIMYLPVTAEYLCKVLSMCKDGKIEGQNSCVVIDRKALKSRLP